MSTQQRRPSGSPNLSFPLPSALQQLTLRVPWPGASEARECVSCCCRTELLLIFACAWMARLSRSGAIVCKILFSQELRSISSSAHGIRTRDRPVTNTTRFHAKWCQLNKTNVNNFGDFEEDVGAGVGRSNTHAEKCQISISE